MQISTLTALILGATASIAAPLEERQATGITPAERTRVIDAFNEAGIVPALIPSLDPKVRLNINYPTIAIEQGTQTESLQTILPPSFSFTPEEGAPADATYSFFLVDPDVPSANGLPVVGLVRLNYLHWYISGVRPGANSGGRTVVFYQLPTPLSPGEQHRYTWLVYREPANYRAQAITPNLRAAFDINAYTQRGRLGTPIGGNYMNQSLTNGIVPEAIIPALPSLPLPTLLPPGIIGRDE